LIVSLVLINEDVLSQELPDSLYHSLEGIQEVKQRVDTLNELAYQYRATNNKLAYRLVKEALNLSIEKSYQKGIGDAYTRLSVIARYSEDYSEALEYAQLSIDVREQLGDTVDLINAYNAKGIVYRKMGKYAFAIEQSLKAEFLANSSIKFNHELGKTLIAIGLLQNRRDSFSLGKIAFEKSLAIFRQEQDRVEIINSLSGLASSNYGSGQLDLAEIYYVEALELAMQEGGDWEYDQMDILINLGGIYSKLGVFSRAENMLEEALRLSKKLNVPEVLDDIYLQLGIVFLNKREYERAEDYLIACEALVEERDDPAFLKLLYNRLFFLYNATGQDSKAIGYMIKENLIEDSINSLASILEIDRLEAKYQSEKKETEFELLEEKYKRNKAESEIRSYWIYALSSTLVVILLLALILVRSAKQKQFISKMNLQMKDQEIQEVLMQQESASFASQLKGQEEERQRIARDLHDRLGNTLATLRLSMQQEEQAKQNVELVDLAVAEVREVAQNISSGVLAKHGLNTALQELKMVIEQSSPLSFQLFLTEEITALGQAFSLELYRIIQELSSNTLKHAQASVITLQTNFIEGAFHLIYEDNGVGFDIDQVKFGMGIKNIQKRVEALEATCHFDAKLNRGTIVIIERHG
ncbi:MAG: tetratricopeptide repeat protein, partial [Flavobacteriales bacterium]|nr:tetratricopeptide repeat protein [Flavobacteriales bacterium]